MFPTINAKETGSNLRRMMHDRGISAKEVQRYLNLGSVQSVYNWWNGINMPTLDNLYALSGWLQIPMDDSSLNTNEKYASRFFACQELKYNWNDK